MASALTESHKSNGPTYNSNDMVGMPKGPHFAFKHIDPKPWDCFKNQQDALKGSHTIRIGVAKKRKEEPSIN